MMDYVVGALLLMGGCVAVYLIWKGVSESLK